MTTPTYSIRAVCAYVCVCVCVCACVCGMYVEAFRLPYLTLPAQPWDRARSRAGASSARS